MNTYKITIKITYLLLKDSGRQFDVDVDAKNKAEAMKFCYDFFPKKTNKEPFRWEILKIEEIKKSAKTN